MKPNKIIFFLLLFMILTAPFVSSFDFGLTIDNKTGISNEEAVAPIQAVQAGLWTLIHFGNRFQLAAQGSYTFTLDKPYFFDLDRLQLTGEFPPESGSSLLFRMDLGRFVIGDFSETVLQNNIDGFRVGFHVPWFNLTAALGYTGLLFKESTSVVLSTADYIDLADSAVLLAPPRLIGAVNLNLPDLFLKQSIDISFLLQQDLRPVKELSLPANERLLLDEGETAFSDTQGGLVNTRYAGLGLSGVIIPALYYDAYGYFGFGKTLSYLSDPASETGYAYVNKDILSYLIGADVRLYLKQILNSLVQVRCIFSSGDADHTAFVEGNTAENSLAFLPISRVRSGIVFTPVFSNIVIPEVNYSIMPLDDLQIILAGLIFLRPTAGNISEDGIDPASSASYLGTEIDLRTVYRLFSDLGLGISGGVFIPSAGDGKAFAAGERKTEFNAQFELSLSL